MSFSLFILLIFILLGRPQDYIEGLAPLRLALVFTLLTAVVSVLENKKMHFGELIKLKEGKFSILS
jgi:hypothetical protein